MRWSDSTARNWKTLVEGCPELLRAPCDVRESSTVADLLLHIFAVELRYAERLSASPETSYDQLSAASVESIFSIHEQAMTLFRALLGREGYDWQEKLTFVTRSAGEMRARRQDVFLHALLHGIRHYAQMATLARHSGHAPDWPMDFLFLYAERI